MFPFFFKCSVLFDNTP